MSEQTILKDDEILDLGLRHNVTGPYSFARAIEQAVLKSREVKAIRHDLNEYIRIACEQAAEIQALRKALGALLPEVEAEIEQRKHSGNAEYWQPLQELADQGRAAMEQQK